MRFWLAVYPDISRPIGGVKQMHRFAESLSSLGFDATLVQESSDFHPGWFSSSVKTISVSSFVQIARTFSSTDYLIIPETYVPHISSYYPGVKKIIFNQNSSYTFGINQSTLDSDPSTIYNLYRHPDVCFVLCVSRYDLGFLHFSLGVDPRKSSIIVNCIDHDLPLNSFVKHPIISFMSRKNINHSKIVTSLIKKSSYCLPWSFNNISNCSHRAVIESLSNSLVFLSFGHPEGFGLPVAEAFASGCIVIGYSGLGGRELFDIASPYQAGYEVQYGDFTSFLTNLNSVDSILNVEMKSQLSRLSRLSDLVRVRYSRSAMVDSVSEFITKLMSSSS